MASAPIHARSGSVNGCLNRHQDRQPLWFVDSGIAGFRIFFRVGKEIIPAKFSR
jgi:hypothetical protein